MEMWKIIKNYTKYKINSKGISTVLNKKQKTHKDFIFEYLDFLYNCPKNEIIDL